MLYDVGTVRGVTCLNNIMYVVYGESSTIRLYSTDTYSPLDVVINIQGMIDPSDMAVCSDDRQLYIGDKDYCIWRVSADDHSYVQWLPTESTTDIQLLWSLSVTSRRLVVTTTSPTPCLRQYSTTDRQLLHHIPLPHYVTGLGHAVETTRQTFVIGHRGTLKDMWQFAVS